MKKLLQMAGLSVLLVALAACAQPLTQADNGKTINLAVDDPFEIELEGNPTTGYTWEVEPYDSSVIKATGEPEYQAETQAIGAGGLYTFRFQTLTDGQATLKFIYHRTFEKDVPPIRTFEVKIVVGTMGQILEK